MIKIFSRRRAKRPWPLQNGYQLAAESLDKQQHKWANYLNGKTAKSSHTSKLIGFLLFCVLFGGGTLIVIFDAFTKKSENTNIPRISVPSHIMSKGTADAFVPIPILTSKQYENVKRFKKLMDSLQTTAAGKVRYDNICKARPGLIDSVNNIEQLFLYQLNTK